MILTLNQIVVDTIDYHILCCNMNIEKAKSEVGKLIQSFKNYKSNQETSELAFYANMGIHRNPMNLGEYLQGYLMAETDGCGFGSTQSFEDSER